jgi:hypothetical protein
MALTDTSPAAAEAQISVLRRLSPEARLELAVDMSATARELLRARVRQEHGEWTECRVEREVLRCTLPGAVLPPPLR